MLPVAFGPNFDAGIFKSAIGDPIRAEMRRVGATRTESNSRFFGAARTEGNSPLLSYSPLNAIVQGDTRAIAARDVTLLQNSVGALLVPPCFDAIVAISLKIDPTDPAVAGLVTALIKAVEGAPQTAIATVDLGARENGGHAAEVHLPCSALAVPEIANSLAALGAPARADWRASSLLLRWPPDGPERHLIHAAIDALTDTPATKDDLRGFVDQVIAEQIFGAGRQPHIKVFRGTSAPQENSIERPRAGA